MNISNSTNSPIDFDVPINIQPAYSLAEQIFRLSTISVGFALNCLLLVVVISSRQLRYPRHLIWSVVAFINIFFLIQTTLKFVAFVNEDRIACQIYVFSAGVEYSLLLLCLSLAALDRYLAIAHQAWYKKRITNRLVLLTLCGSLAFEYIVLTSPYWTGYKSVGTCTVNLTHMHWVLCWDLLLGIVCFILLILIFIKSTTAIREYPQIVNEVPFTVQFQNDRSQHRLDSIGIGEFQQGSTAMAILPIGQVRQQLENENLLNEVNEQNITTQLSQIETINFTQPRTALPDVRNVSSRLQMRSNVNRLEIRAAICFSLNVLPFWLCTFPVTCNGIAVYWCIRLDSTCSLAYVINPYLLNMFLFHVIYNPLVYMLTSQEFRRAVSHFFRQRFYNISH